MFYWLLFLPSGLYSQMRPAAPRQKYVSGWVLGLARKLTQTFCPPTLRLIFTAYMQNRLTNSQRYLVVGLVGLVWLVG